MRVSEHLSTMHKAMAKHERALAAHCEKTAGNLMTLHKESGMKDEDASTEKTLADHFTKAAAMHEHQAESHDAMLDECVKATSTDDLTKNQMAANRGFSSLDGISAIAPPAPRAIPRIGQPQELGKSEVDVEFVDLFKSE